MGVLTGGFSGASGSTDVCMGGGWVALVLFVRGATWFQAEGGQL